MNQLQNCYPELNHAKNLLSNAVASPLWQWEFVPTQIDRFNQAMYRVGHELEKRDVHVLSGSLLKRLALTQKFLKPSSGESWNALNKTIDGILSQAQSGKIKLADSSSLIQLNCTGDEVGHCFGLQIDLEQGRYVFWDVNYGYYVFSSLESLKEGLQLHIDTSWKDKFYRYTPIHFIPKP